MPDESGRLTFDILSLDLEVGIQDHRIRAFAGVRKGTGQSLVYPNKGRGLPEALDKLADLADGADFLLVLQRRFLNLVSFWPETASRKAS